MLISADLMRALLSLSLTGMLLLAALYLRSRELPFRLYLAWGLFALLVPLLGPFLAIYRGPGRARRSEAASPTL